MQDAKVKLSHRCGGGFTLIELLVAIALLSVIVVAVTNLFTHSTGAWDSGTRRAQSMMVGRALMDFFVRESTMALCDPDPTPAGFEVLKGTQESAFRDYSLNDLFGNTASLSATAPSVTFVGGSPPLYGSYRITVTTDDKGRSEPRYHTGRAFMWNRDRYQYD